MEQHISKSIWQYQEHDHENTTMAFDNENEELYLETDSFGVGLGARDGMQFPRKKYLIV